MANVGNQKVKILKLMDIFMRESDVDHPLTAQVLIEKLEAEGIAAERKSIYRDVAVLQEYGMDIEKAQEGHGYYLASRTFELPELKLLVDAVAASKFITEKKSRELVEKIETLASKYEGKQLQRQVVVSDRIKTDNERIYYVIDEIYQCIDNNHQISFQYMEWNEKKELALRHEGKTYVVSPEFLLWDNEYYYLVAYDDASKEIRHYRVDKMTNAKELEEGRLGAALRGTLIKGDYTKKTFGMFAGEKKVVKLRAPKSYAGILIDRFGTDISLRLMESDIVARVEVEVSPQFFGWISGLGANMILEGPDDVRGDYLQYLKGIMRNYGEDAYNV